MASGYEKLFTMHQAGRMRGLIDHAAPIGPRIAQARHNPLTQRFLAGAKNHNKMIAAGVAAGIGINMLRTRSGRPTDRVMGRPTGMYNF